jgi:hypothetical protein
MIKSIYTRNPDEEAQLAQEENVEDVYLAELHRKHAALKAERKKAEQDAFLLVNRMKLLKGEETKTIKKIEVTKKKTSEKMSNLIASEENLKNKLALKEERERELENKKVSNSKFKSELELSLLMKRELKMKQITEEAKLLKEQKKLNQEMLGYIKNEEQVNNKSKAEYIINQRIQLEEKKRAIELEKKQKIRADLEQKLFQEQLLKEQAESKIVDLEQEEIDIMRKIRTTTQVHRSSKNLFFMANF